ncbi:MAG: CtsR family transcriptional regulator [Clostridia bacterium]|nr:CtsR family transcriptional regulator [Clostridia bacterium]
MKISDEVAAYILDLLNEADGTAEIQRNELANLMGCVPSQINYVITSRFTPEQGYIVESRRGGKGYIRITRRPITKSDMIMHIVNSIGDRIDEGSCRAMLVNLLHSGVISEKTAKIISVATADKTLYSLQREQRDIVRCSLFKNLLLVAE